MPFISWYKLQPQKQIAYAGHCQALREESINEAGPVAWDVPTCQCFWSSWGMRALLGGLHAGRDIHRDLDTFLLVRNFVFLGCV